MTSWMRSGGRFGEKIISIAESLSNQQGVDIPVQFMEFPVSLEGGGSEQKILAVSYYTLRLVIGHFA